MTSIKKIEYSSYLLAFMSFLLLSSCGTSMDKKWNKLEKEFANDNVDMKVRHVNMNDSLSVNYLSVKSLELTNKTFVFIHGAPGSASDFSKFLKNDSIRREGNILSVDRLGYGSATGREYSSIPLHAESIVKVMEDWEREMKAKQQFILIGHSYGGPIAAYTCLNTLEKVSWLILLAPAMSADLEPMKWYSKWAQSKVIYSILPSSLKVATDEKAHHAAALKEIEQDWQKISTPTIMVHGKKDGLVPFENMEFVKKHWKAPLSTVILEENGHIFPFTNPEIVVKVILDTSEKLD
ncbi:alpha/beta fold hydrolase [Flammeovirga pacifica]|nr:alpha/beta hydrolase [Flammeovirga pacifica]